MQRSVYHKYTELEVEVPDNIKDEKVQDYLIENPQIYEYEMDSAINEVKYEFGFGLYNDGGLDEKDNESEWRYDIVGKQYGGHL